MLPAYRQGPGRFRLGRGGQINFNSCFVAVLRNALAAVISNTNTSQPSGEQGEAHLRACEARALPGNTGGQKLSRAPPSRHGCACKRNKSVPFDGATNLKLPLLLNERYQSTTGSQFSVSALDSS